MTITDWTRRIRFISVKREENLGDILSARILTRDEINSECNMSLPSSMSFLFLFSKYTSKESQSNIYNEK